MEVLINSESFRVNGAVVAINADGDPLAPGSLSGDASAANQAAVQANAGSNASKVVSVQGVTGGKTLPVTAAATDTKLDALIALVGAADDNPGDLTLMGQLKQIAVNTTPP